MSSRLGQFTLSAPSHDPARGARQARLWSGADDNPLSGCRDIAVPIFQGDLDVERLTLDGLDREPVIHLKGIP